MKPHNLLLLFALLLAAPLRAQDVAYNDFVQKFSKALEYADESGMDKAVRSHARQALQHFSYLLWQDQMRPDDSRESVLKALKASWERAMKTRTMEEYERYIVSRTEEQHRDLMKAEGTERTVWGQYTAAQKSGSRDQLEVAAQSAVNLAKTYDALGHALHAAQMWSLASQITISLPDKTLEERRRSVEYLENFIARREQWDWTKDSHYLTNKNWIKAERERIKSAAEAATKRQAEGYDPNVKGVDSMLLPGAKEQVVPLEFHVLKKPNLDMFARGGSAPGQWMLTQIDNKGPTSVAYFKGRDLYLVRPSNSKFGVTLDGSEPDMTKNKYEPIDISTKFKPSLFYLGKDKTDPYAMWFYMSSERDIVAGLTAGLAHENAREKAIVYYHNASSWVGQIGGETVTFFDDNANGKLFEENPLDYDLRDRTFKDHRDGIKVPAFDSMQVGKGPPTPISSFVQIGDKWFNISGGDRTHVVVRECNPAYLKIGTLELSWKGPRSIKPEVLVLSGKGTFAGAHYNIAGSKTVDVPVGEYTISFGRIEQGSGARASFAQIYRGDMEPVIVEEGKTTPVEIGGPFKLDFEKGGDKWNIEIDAMSIRVLGRSGERYARISEAPTPDVIVAKKPGRGGKKVGEFMPMNLDYYLLASKKFSAMYVDLCFFPAPKGEFEGTMVLKVTNPIPGGFVGLRQKKHKMFGRLETIWKQ